MRTIIGATTEAALSYEFKVLPWQSTFVVASGLSGSERMFIQIKNCSGQFQNIENIDSVLTQAKPQATISVAGDYKVLKEATNSLSGCCIGELS